MSILIKGMEMPKKCGQCKLFHAEYPMYCMAVKGYRTVGAPYGMPRPDWCPIIELPFAEELAEKLYKQIEKAVIEAEGETDGR